MLLVTVFRDSKGYIASFEAEGHTECVPKGEPDIVCAGASAIVEAAVLGCMKLLGITPGLEKKDGYLYFSLPDDLSADIAEKAQVILETMVLSLREMQGQFSGSISFAEESILL